MPPASRASVAERERLAMSWRRRAALAFVKEGCKLDLMEVLVKLAEIVAETRRDRS